MEEHGLTVSESLVWLFGELSGARVPHARDEAEFMLMHILGCPRSELFLNARRVLTEKEETLLHEAASRRLKREPAQYIFGESEFRGRAFKVTRDVLIPRPETELLVEEAARHAPSLGPDLKIIDLCTGSGCIAISVALETGAEVYATDISSKALDVAKGNSMRLGAATKTTFLLGDLFGPLPTGLKGRAAMVLANPPYINEKDMETLEPEVADFEPKEALYGGADGMDVIRRIIAEAPEYLAPGGLLLMEMGYDQAKAVRSLTEASRRYEQIEIMKDYAGIERILKASPKG